MSWHFSLVRGGGFLEENFSDGQLFAPLNGTNTQENALSQDKMMEVCIHSQYGTMSKHLTGNRGVDLLISSLEASRAKISQQQEDQIEKELKGAKAECGPICPESFAKLDLDMCLWKTHQHSLFGGLEQFLEIWPRWGMMQNGECFRLEMLAHDTSVREFGLSPTIGTPIKSQRSRSEHFTSPAKNPYELCPKGYLPHPEWVENLMGWPIGWTDLKELETDKFLKWLSLHGNY